MSIIYYGIDGKLAKASMDKWVNITGKPDVFVVKDSNIKNFKNGSWNNYKVASIDEALNLYPNAEVWITYRDSATAALAGHSLIKKMPSNKIHFLEANLEYRKSCGRLGRSFHYTNGKIPMCTAGNRNRPKLEVSGSIREKIVQWQGFSAKLIDANQLESPNKCLGCPQLKFGFWPKVIKPTNLRFLQDLRMDICNFRCVYCVAAKSKKWAKLKDVDGPSTFDVLREFAKIPEFVELGNTFTITFANGELCANIHFDEIMDLLLSTEWNIELLSNLSLYREKLATLMSTGRIKKIITSIDAGTRETFHKVKQNDRFDYVIDNLRRYPLDKTALYLKYLIIEGINDNERDFDAFYDIVKEFGATIQLSADNSTNKKPFTDNAHIAALVLRLIDKAKSDGVRVIADNNNINPIDVQFIRDSYAKALAKQ